MWPENTLRAFRGAASLGCRFFETDVRITSDGALVCFHDSTLDRTTNGRGPVAGVTLQQLQSLDAGYQHQADGGFPFRGVGETSPTLREAIESLPDSSWVIDLKAAGTAAPLAELIESLALHDRVIVGSFSSAFLAEFRHLTRGEVPTSVGSAETVRAVVAARAGRGLDPFPHSHLALAVPETWYGIPVVTSELLEIAHSRGRLVHVWTINDPTEMQRFAALGVDGIITDRPDVAQQVLGA